MIFKNLDIQIIVFVFAFFLLGCFYIFQSWRLDFALRDLFKKGRWRHLNHFNYFNRRLSYVSLGLLVFVLSLASLNPSWGNRQTSIEIENLDILFVIDASRSMSVRDADGKSRLVRAKQAIRLLNSRLEGSRMGIVAFAGTAFYYCPITGDLSGFDEFLEALNPEVVGNQGSGLGDVNRMLKDIFNHRKASYPVMIFISDGEFHNDDAITDSFVNGQGDKVPAFVLGVGSEKGGQVYYAPDPFSLNEVPLVLNNVQIKSKYNRKNLMKLAGDVSGSYYYVNDSLLSVIKISDSLKGSLSKVQSQKMRSSVISRVYIFAWPALILLIIIMFVDSIRKNKKV